MTISSVIVSDYERYQDEFRAEIRQLFEAGLIRNVETRVHGLENVAGAFVGLFGASHLGKVVITLE